MSLLGLLLRPVQSALSGPLRQVFEADVRHNPTIVNPIRQSDDDDAYQKEQRFGFAPQYVVSPRRPRTDLEAQRLYNHIRTVSWYLDAIPILGRSLPFNIGFESIIGFIPGVGDYIGFVLSLYAVILSALFGLPLRILGLMMVNIVVDAFIGLVPIVGDALDVAFKANLRNLRLMEDHLISTEGKCHAGQFQLSFPPSNVFLPQDSPQRNRPMPEVSSSWTTGTSQRWGWNTTSTSAPANRRSGRVGQQDFGKGTMEEVMHGRQEGESPSSTTIVPNEIFTTMRYEEDGTSLRQMCAAIPSLSQRLQEQEEKFPLLDRHVARLLASVEAMKKHYPSQWSQCQLLGAGEVRKRIEDAAQSEKAKGSTRRIRVSVSQSGAIAVRIFSMAPSKANMTQTVRFDRHDQSEAEEAPTILYKYKTSYRQMYDAARHRANATLGIKEARQQDDKVAPCFDVIMSHRSYITESSIANILVYYHQSAQIYTPSAGDFPLLPGLMRQELLSRGLIIEQSISKVRLQSDLESKGASLYLCNALRGIIPVTLVN